MLELINVSFEVDTENEKKEILKDVSLKIEDRFVAITGPNGGGKTTLAKLIAGVVTPSSGKIILEKDGKDIDITDINVTDRARSGIAYAFQQPVRFKGLTVRNLLETAAGRKMEKSEKKVQFKGLVTGIIMNP